MRALLRLADRERERGGLPAEREAAHAKTQALADRHGIALDWLADLPDDLAAGEHAVVVGGPHRVWASILLMDVAAAFGSLRLTRDGATLAGPADDVARVARAHAEAWSSVHAGHDALVSALTPDARGARRYLHARYPDPSYHADVLGHLRYWPAARLERDVAAVLTTRRGRARAIARALRQGRVAPDDVTPSEAVSPRLLRGRHVRDPPAPARPPGLGKNGTGFSAKTAFSDC